MLNVTIYLLLGILILTAVLMVLIVLMQRPKNEGLGAAFGGGMTQDLFGAQTTNVLQKFTVYLGAVFFGVCLLLTVLYSRTSTQTSDVQKTLAASSAVSKPKKALPSPTPAAPVATTPAVENNIAPSVDALIPVTPAAATMETIPAAPIATPGAVATP